MKSPNDIPWSPAKSEELYGFRRWGNPHFAVDDTGKVTVDPLADGRPIRILDVIEEARSKGLQAPMVIRFQDLLHQRVVALNNAFINAIRSEGYPGTYRGVFPIKVNQLREVVEEILWAGRKFSYGLEAGSKPELIAALAMHESNDRLLICNGYKDDDYIRLALLGRKLGRKIILVVEQASEIPRIIALSKETGVKPWIGIRAKLNTRGEGKWALSTGDNAKFGLSTTEILAAANQLRKAKLIRSLRLLHFHIGSQVPNIITIKNAVTEAARYYVQLVRMGFPMGYLDVGGGLGIDYDGSRTNFESSMNYSMEEYARDVVFNVRDVCESSDVTPPTIVSESGRAVTAPHSLLVLEVFERISKMQALPELPDPDNPPKVVVDLQRILDEPAHYSRLERFHDALAKKEEAFSLFNLGFLDLAGRALAESIFWRICRQIDKDSSSGYQPEELIRLKQMLSDQYVCNFSVFQSLLDHWALDQLFPIAPLHRLDEKPTVNATLVDITCDSDGKISRFIDLEDVRDYLPLHPLNGQPYYLGVFMVGAYQDIMGDIHNLFGRVSEAHVFLEEDEEDGFYIEETISGNLISEVLQGVQYSTQDLSQRMKKQVNKAIRANLVKPREGVRLTEFFDAQLTSKTYLNINYEREPEPPPVQRRKK
ncbi:MAG: biosynthetic arginine decarboxylase [Opitutaceae bacterium]